MAIDRSNIKGRSIGPEKFSIGTLTRRYCLETFMHEPIALERGSVSFPGGTDTNRIITDTGFGNRFEYTYFGGASDLFLPVLGSEGGWDWHLDKDTLNEGVTINFGGQIAGHPRVYRPASESFFARVLLNCEDASGLNAFFGFQDAGTIPAGYTDWTNVFGLRIFGDDSSTTAVVRAESNLGNSGSTDVVTQDSPVTVEEPTEVELEIRVQGKVGTVWVNGIQRGTGSLITTFTGTPSITPTARLVQSTDLTTTITTRAFECGPLIDRYEGSLRSLLTLVGVAAGT